MLTGEIYFSNRTNMLNNTDLMKPIIWLWIFERK